MLQKYSKFCTTPKVVISVLQGYTQARFDCLAPHLGVTVRGTVTPPSPAGLCSTPRSTYAITMLFVMKTFLLRIMETVLIMIILNILTWIISIMVTHDCLMCHANLLII